MKKTFVVIILLLLSGFYVCAQNKPLKVKGEKSAKPSIVKLGTIDCDLVETTPVVFKNKVHRFEYVRERYWANETGNSYFRFIDHKSGKSTRSFAEGMHLGSAYVKDKNVIVTGVEKWGAQRIHIFSSRDLKNWSSWVAFDFPGVEIFNTSLIHDGNRYVLMFEISSAEEGGAYFTARFATSTDLKKWEILPKECNYARDRYTAPHCLRYLNGYYYNFYLEAHQGYEMRVVRTKDFINWEISPFNPVLAASEDDKKIYHLKLNERFHQRIIDAENLNNSDIDFCEYKGKVIINYSWGNQAGVEFLAEAYFDGTMDQFLQGWFPE